MKALPLRLAGTWQKAECDPEGKVEYLLEPVTNRVHLMLGNKYQNAEGDPAAEAAAAVELLQWQLRGLRGLELPEGGEFTLKFTSERYMGKDTERVSDETVNRLPPELLGELLIESAQTATLSQQEREDIPFTSPSAGPESPVEGMSEAASMTAETAACA